MDNIATALARTSSTPNNSTASNRTNKRGRSPAASTAPVSSVVGSIGYSNSTLAGAGEDGDDSGADNNKNTLLSRISSIDNICSSGSIGNVGSIGNTGNSNTGSTDNRNSTMSNLSNVSQKSPIHFSMMTEPPEPSDDESSSGKDSLGEFSIFTEERTSFRKSSSEGSAASALGVSGVSVSRQSPKSPLSQIPQIPQKPQASSQKSALRRNSDCVEVSRKRRSKVGFSTIAEDCAEDREIHHATGGESPFAFAAASAARAAVRLSRSSDDDDDDVIPDVSDPPPMPTLPKAIRKKSKRVSYDDQISKSNAMSFVPTERDSPTNFDSLVQTAQDTQGSQKNEPTGIRHANSMETHPTHSRKRSTLFSSGLIDTVRRVTGLFGSSMSSDNYTNQSQIQQHRRTQTFTIATPTNNEHQPQFVPPHTTSGAQHAHVHRNRTTIMNRGDRDSLGARSSLNSEEDYSLSGTGHPSESPLREVNCDCCFPCSSWCGGGMSCCHWYISEESIHGMLAFLNHRMWKTLNYLSTFIMLFGSQLQDLLFPKSWDGVIDGVFTVAFVILLVDIVIRSLVDPKYFAWSFKQNNLSDGGGHGVENGPPLCNGFWVNRDVQIGSFMFWCDLVAAFTFLWDISYINPIKRNQVTFILNVNRYGVPAHGFSTGAQYSSTNVQWELVVTVGRAARIARFIRTSVVVEMTRKLNCMQFLHIKYWIRFIPCRFFGPVRRNKRDTGGDMDVHRMTGTSSGTLKSMMARRDSSLSITVSGRRNSDIEVENDGNFSNFTYAPGKNSPHLASLDEKPQVHTMPSNTSDGGGVRNGKGGKFAKNIAAAVGILKKPKDVGDRSTTGSGESVSHKSRKEKLFGGSVKESSSHVGAAMRELTGQRVVLGIMTALLLSVFFTYRQEDGTNGMAMVLLHGQTGNAKFADLALNNAKSSVIPSLYNYTRANLTNIVFHQVYDLQDGVPTSSLREREKMNITVTTIVPFIATQGIFDNRLAVYEAAKVELITTLFIIVVWILGVTSFAGPVMTLVIKPIERMITLLTMLMNDPLDYESTQQYQQFKQEEDEIADNSMWTKEVLRGMETSFLMTTILRIGSLMKVGFGSAGVEIIRNNLEKGRRKDVLFLNKQGSTVSCIFLFCDIRQFTDATECLQEEVFVFTNKIAAVVHSICHSYGGSANKNIGDAFLVSWLLDEEPSEEDIDESTSSFSSNQINVSGHERLRAYRNQADKALLSVVKISIALHFDEYFISSMNEEARGRLLTKLSKRKGPVVQMGFGLHAGVAVQGAIGSQRKLDATYISESVERAEFLESNTKKYGVPLLMSDAFYNLLDQANRYRCRKIDQIIILTEETGDISDPREIVECGEKMELYTFDMDIDALFKTSTNEDENSIETSRRSHNLKRRDSKIKEGSSLKLLTSARRPSVARNSKLSADVLEQLENLASSEEPIDKPIKKRTLVLPTDVCKYSDRSWLEPDMKKIRRIFVSNGIIFPKFSDGLKSYYSKDWDHAKSCFETVLSQIDDGPSRYYLQCMHKNNGVPPKNFIGYGMG